MGKQNVGGILGQFNHWRTHKTPVHLTACFTSGVAVVGWGYVLDEVAHVVWFGIKGKFVLIFKPDHLKGLYIKREKGFTTVRLEKGRTSLELSDKHPDISPEEALRRLPLATGTTQ